MTGRTFAVALVFILVTGCQSVRARRLATTEQALEDGHSIIIVSTSAEETCFFSWQVDIYPTGTFRPIGAVAINHSLLKSDFSDRIGFFDAFIVQPGDYDLRVVSSTGEINHSFSPLRFLGPTFRLRPGEMVYVGDVHVGGCHSLSPVLVDAWSAVRSEFQVRFPRLDVQRVVRPRPGAIPSRR